MHDWSAESAGDQPLDLPAVDIILVNWNGWQDTVECLESVFRLRYPAYRVIVCDNDSSDQSADRIEQWAKGALKATAASRDFQFALDPPRRPATVDCIRHHAGTTTWPLDSEARLVILETGKNLGFAGGNNVGMRYGLATGEMKYFWLLNTDTVVHPDALLHLVARAESADRPGMVGSSLIYYWHPDLLQALGGAALNPKTTSVGHIGADLGVERIPPDPAEVEGQMAYVVGASLLASRAFVEDIGLMCEDYFLYFEEIDWALRAKGRYALGYAPHSRVYHKVGGSSRKVASLTANRYLYRNRLKFVARFAPDRFSATLWSLFLAVFRYLFRGRLNLAKLVVETLLDKRLLFQEGRNGVGRKWT